MKRMLWLFVIVFLVSVFFNSLVFSQEGKTSNDHLKFTVFATREGTRDVLKGATTANGHVIKPDDRFVALPSRRVLCPTDKSREFEVRITYKGKSLVAPVWDVGPWNELDNYWDTERDTWGIDEYSLKHGFPPLGTPMAQVSSRDNWHYGYTVSRTGYINGKWIRIAYDPTKKDSGTQRKVSNPAGIDLADAIFVDDLGMKDNDLVEVEFLWTHKPTPPQGGLGGIVAADGKGVVYYDLETGKKTVLVSGNIGIAASDEDGKLLAWQDEKGFTVRLFPDGKTFSISLPEIIPYGKPACVFDGKVFYHKLASGQIKNLTVSHNRPFISFETLRKGDRYVPYNPDLGSSDERLFLLYDKEKKLPWYYYRLDVFISANFISISPNSTNGLGGPTGYFGWGEEPPPHPYIVKYSVKPERIGTRENFTGKVMGDDDHPRYPESREEKQRLREKRLEGMCNARFPVWSKGGDIIAVIHQTNLGWGPIEISNFNRGDTNAVDEEYKMPYDKLSKEIPISLKDCKGLAWRPPANGRINGVLTYLSEGSVRSIDNTLIAQGINATRFLWITDTMFIFRAPDGSLWAWENSKTRKLLDSVPEEFSYCSRSPLSTTGRNRVENGYFFVGTAKSFCKICTGDYREVKIFGKKFVRIYTKVPIVHIPERTTPLTVRMPQVTGYEESEFVVLSEINLEDIKDPSQYFYKTNDKEDTIVRLNQVIILKRKDGTKTKYTAIKPIEINEGMITQPTEDSIRQTGEYMVYEWRVWEDLPKK